MLVILSWFLPATELREILSSWAKQLS